MEGLGPMRFLAALLALPLAAAITNVEVTGVTATQAVVRYTAPDTSACTHEVSDSATYTPLVNGSGSCGDPSLQLFTR